MTDEKYTLDTVVDYITGDPVPDVGAEANRQAVERILVEEKGYDRTDITVSAPMAVTVGGEPYRTTLDLVVSVSGTRYMVIKCAAGSLGSREREVRSAACLLDEGDQVPLAVVSDGQTAVVLDTVSGKRIGEGLEAVPDRSAAEAAVAGRQPQPLAPERREREALVFKSYDEMNVNRLPVK